MIVEAEQSQALKMAALNQTVETKKRECQDLLDQVESSRVIFLITILHNSEGLSSD